MRPGRSIAVVCVAVLLTLTGCTTGGDGAAPQAGGDRPTATALRPTDEAAAKASALPSVAAPPTSGPPTPADAGASAPPPAAPAQPPPAPAPSAEPVPSAAPAPSAVPFTFTISVITPELRERMASSWRPGCPVPLEGLRYVTVTFIDFDGAARTGEMVVHADAAEPLVEVFARLHAVGFPIRSMRLVDDFGGDDTASMDADNTSAFNCRAINGGTAWSEHAYGKALDLNPLENPYVLGRHVAPEGARPFVSRPQEPGVIHADGPVVQAFAAIGWVWGGSWSSPVDYQHFSATGR